MFLTCLVIRLSSPPPTCTQMAKEAAVLKTRKPAKDKIGRWGEKEKIFKVCVC